MRPPNFWGSFLLHAFDAITLFPTSNRQTQQKIIDPNVIAKNAYEGPIFAPPYPHHDRPPPDVAIKCDYTAMGDEWIECNVKDDRGCWPKGPSGTNFGIDTDYERFWPKGTTRKYTLDVSEMALAPDGVCMPHAKVFNGSYPGPWIQACWGDDLEITVRNHLWHNGTTIHWHGIRQHDTVGMDGVNGVTQCPIAPGKEFTYKFKAIQYGSSWYHSHYSLQYADGLAGPMTIYGPSTENYTEAIEPILMTDWNHRSAFEDWSWSRQPEGKLPQMTNILLNGKGGKKYLLRLINTSLDTTFIFAIDGHNVTVIGADFVPIKPYNTTSVLVGIGQRYHVIVDATPVVPSADQNYWIRTIPALGCSGFATPPDNRTGIIRYDPRTTADPTTARSDFPTNCSDEPYESLIPKLPWKVGNASNEESLNGTYDVGLMRVNGTPYHPVNFSKPRWNADQMPMWLNFSEPTILNLDTYRDDWPNFLDVVTMANEHVEEAWLYLVIIGMASSTKHHADPSNYFASVAHPIHSHGHDFALLAQSNETYPGNLSSIAHKLKTDNPPRRDVVLLPKDGYIVIAFKIDNPGTWLLHCHIAWHASSGLAFQILENKHKISIAEETKGQMDETCMQWNDWWGDVANHWDNSTKDEFQDDSGI